MDMKATSIGTQADSRVLSPQGEEGSRIDPEVGESTRNGRAWRDALTLLAIGADVLLIVLAAGHQSGPLRYWLGLGFVLFIPGWGISRWLRLDWPAVELTVSIGASLALNLVVAQAMLMAHAWHPEWALLCLSIATLALLVPPLFHNWRSAGRMRAPS